MSFKLKPWLAKHLWFEFMVGEGLEMVCGLCGNSGKLKGGPVITARGIVRQRPDHWCICPNGRTIKKQLERLNK